MKRHYCTSNLSYDTLKQPKWLLKTVKNNILNCQNDTLTLSKCN